jgi:hypothetical protein
VNYGFPVGTFIAAVALWSTIVVAVFLCNVALRWARVVE